MDKKDEMLLDAKAVAVQLGVSRKTVYRAVKSGRIEAYGYRVMRLERVLRFEKMDLSAGVLALGQVWKYQVRIES